MTKTKHVVHVSTDVSMGCAHCSFHVGGPHNFAESVNHYIVEHGYSVLHVGSETISGPKSEPWHTTVAVLGK